MWTLDRLCGKKVFASGIERNFIINNITQTMSAGIAVTVAEDNIEISSSK
jgi:hypothetical protein